MRQTNNQTTGFEKLTGHLMVQYKDHYHRLNNKFGLMFTDSNVGDAGAIDTFNIWSLKKFNKIEKDITNSKVNLQNPVSRQRGSKFIILDVSNLVLDKDEILEFWLAYGNRYDSNSWIMFKSVGLTLWLSMILFRSLSIYQSYGQHEFYKPSSWEYKALLVIFIALDKFKDPWYLFAKSHTKWFELLYSLTIVIPFQFNFWINQIQMRYKEDDTRYDEYPREIPERKLFLKTLCTEFGLEYEELSKKKDSIAARDVDFGEKRCQTLKNIYLFNNTLQIILILGETFQLGETITFIAMFNITVGLLTSTWVFSEHVGISFAAKFDYVTKDRILDNLHRYS